MSNPGARSRPFDLNAAPMRIGMVRLKVRALERISRFYQDVLGLRLIKENPNGVTLGTSAMPLLELIGDGDFAPRDPRTAGLFHTAFLLPDRVHLARWLTSVKAQRVQLLGASDHKVSEAIYLADPEGNGIEVYADRSPSEWQPVDGRFEMPSDPLDIEALLGQAEGGRWAGIPKDSVIGHVHLQVGDTAEAERFYGALLGFDVTARYPGGSFFGTGGYHHQLAANTWRSAGAGPRSDKMAGLEAFQIQISDSGTVADIEARSHKSGVSLSDDRYGLTLRDPWGIAITLVSE